MKQPRQCWRCLRYYKSSTGDKHDCPNCGRTVQRLRKEPKQADITMKFIFSSVKPFVFLKCSECNKIDEFNNGTIGWVCHECYERVYHDVCDMCDKKKPDDVGEWCHPFWICDSCARDSNEKT